MSAVTTQRVYALIFNGITHGSSDDYWLPLSERERLAAAVYAELLAGGVEVRPAYGLTIQGRATFEG